jgi:hypothetical protein
MLGWLIVAHERQCKRPIFNLEDLYEKVLLLAPWVKKASFGDFPNILSKKKMPISYLVLFFFGNAIKLNLLHF